MKARKNILFDIIAVMIMVGFALAINRSIQISGLYMDDLYTWSCYAEGGLKDFLFPEGSPRFRPLFKLITYLELMLIKNNIHLCVYVNLAVIIAAAVLVYCFALYLSGGRVVSLLAALAVIASRFSYYAVGQMLGTLESVSMLLTIGEAFLLIDYMDSGKTVEYYLALFIFILSVFTHERYIVFIVMFGYVLAVTGRGGRKKSGGGVLKWVITAAVLAAVIIVRRCFTGTVLPAGTGGSDVVGDFDMARTISSIKEEAFYLLGINKGPEYLSGIEWGSVGALTKFLIYISIAAMVFLAVRFIIAVIGSRSKKAKSRELLRDVVFLLGYIIGSVAASCVTIRVEMRWLYTPSVFLLLLLAYMYGYIKFSKGGKCAFTSIIFIIYLSLNILTNLKYRQSWENIYFFPEQKSYNSLAQETWEKYGEGIFDKSIYIVGNPYEVTDFYKDYFFRVYDETGSGRSPSVTFVDSIDQVPAGDDIIILMPDTANHTYATIGR